MKVVVTPLLLCALAALPVAAQAFYVTPDVPTDLGPVTLLPWAVARGGSGPWYADVALPAGSGIGALHRLGDGGWLFVVASPATLGGMDIEPRDVVRLDGGVYSLWFDGDVAGVPAGAAFDALYVPDLDPLPGAPLVVSFTAPLQIAGSTFEPADLVRIEGGVYSLELDASETTPPIPPTADVIAAARLGDAWILSFAAPTEIGAYTFRPGQLVAWDGTFTVLPGDPDWPPTSAVNALAFPASPGAVPSNLRLDKVRRSPGRLRLSWDSSCSTGAEDYSVYEGALGDWYSHQAIDCTDDGADLAEELQPAAGNRYYLIVPRNENEEGSYGLDYRGGTFSQRPQPVAKSERCVEPQGLATCF